MTLTQLLFNYVYPLLVGLGLGLFYYGGLWLVLRNLQRLKHPAVWMSLSLLLRILGVLLVLYLLFGHAWQQLLLAVLGMLISRSVLVQRLRPSPQPAHKTNGATP